ncbi:MAG: hypothetical protein Q8Q81_04050 [Oxalobacteraceae bacterium]|nr:hypothetical protein [Oxalobacteraceae bacterium]
MLLPYVDEACICSGAAAAAATQTTNWTPAGGTDLSERIVSQRR